MMAGWIKLHRGIFDNKIWGAEAYSKPQAFIDLILSANHTTNTTGFSDGSIHYINRGEMITSQAKLADKWHWDRNKVRRFLTLLKDNNMIDIVSSKFGYTKIRIINYDKYQSEEKKEKKEVNNYKPSGAGLNFV